jgi:hypothetical protein
MVAELIAALVVGGPLRRAVEATQARAVAELRGTDYRALLEERLAPVLEGR